MSTITKHRFPLWIRQDETIINTILIDYINAMKNKKYHTQNDEL